MGALLNSGCGIVVEFAEFQLSRISYSLGMYHVDPGCVRLPCGLLDWDPHVDFCHLCLACIEWVPY